MNLFYLWVLSKTLLCGCGPDTRRYDFGKVRSKYTIDKIAKLPDQITESSGLAHANDAETYWTHNDGGSPAELFRIGTDGSLKEIRSLAPLKNRDWEEMAEDGKGRLFVGDFGNNLNNRKDLAIYIVHENQPETEPGKITFRYGDQQSFPETKKNRHYDCEAMFFHQDTLYLFSKNTARSPRYTRMYKLPARPGDYTLYPADSIRLNETITGADISRDGNQFALLSYGKIFFFGINDGRIGFSAPSGCLRFFKGQTEALLFKREGEILLTNEKGRMFLLSPRH